MWKDKIVEGLTAVRKRPGLYVGSVDDPLVSNRLLQDAACMALDDWAAGACHRLDVEIFPAGHALLEDDGPGWPLQKMQDGQTLAERIMTMLYACREHKKSAEVSRVICNSGMAVLNALSEWFRLWIFQDGTVWHQSYTRGNPDGPLAPTGETAQTGTRLEFQLDAAILSAREFMAPEIFAWLHERAPCLNIRLVDHRTGIEYPRPRP